MLGIGGVGWAGPEAQAGAPEGTFLEHLQEYAPYLGGDPTFDCRNTRAALPDLPGRGVFHRNTHGGKGGGLIGLQDVLAHGVARRLVQEQDEVVEAHHLVEPAGQLVEQRGQVAV